MKDTILIVEDDPVILRLIEAVLQKEGYPFLSSTDGIEAQDLIQQKSENITAILLDWMLPKMSGIDLLRWIKEQPQLEQIPVIMETAMDRVENIKEGIDAGAFYYLTKPFEKELLLAIMKAAVSDFHYKESLLRKLKESENPFALLKDGTFRYRTPAEAEYLSVRIANACPVPRRAMAISELLLNAVEHGNLAIMYEEKTNLINKGILSSTVKERLNSPEYSKKYVEIQFKKHPAKITVLITDQGPGFDFEKYLHLDSTRVFDNHGRGIAITNACLDLQYLGSGNRVLVTLPLGCE